MGLFGHRTRLSQAGVIRRATLEAKKPIRGSQNTKKCITNRSATA